MSDNSLGNMVVEYKASLVNLVEGSRRAQAEIRQVGSAATETGSKLAGGFGASIEHARGSLLNFGSQLTMVAFGLKGLADAAVQTAQSMLAPSAAMEQASVTMDTLMHSADAAQGELKLLWDFAANTPFEFKDVEQAGAKLLAVGFAARDVIPDLTAIGDALSALGQSTGADLQGVVDVFGQIRNTGHLMAQDMMQLTDRGIPAWRILSEQMHLSVAELQNMTSKGLIPADQAINMLTKGMEQAFGGGMQKQSKTFLGLISTIHDNIEAAWRSMVGPAFQAAKKGLEDLGNLVASKSFQEFASVVGQELAPAFHLIGQDIDAAAKGLQAWFDNQGNLGQFSATMHDIGNSINDGWRAVKEFANWIPIATQNYQYWMNVMDVGRNTMGLSAGSAASLGNALGYVMASAAGAIGFFVGLANTIEEVMRAVAQSMNAIASWSNQVLGTGFGMIDLSQFSPIDVNMLPEQNRMSSGNFSGSNFSGSGSSGTGGFGGTGGSGSGSGSGRHKKPGSGSSSGPGGDVAPPGSSGFGSGIGTGGSGSANNILIVLEIDGQVFASQVVQQVYDQVRLRLGPGGFSKA